MVAVVGKIGNHRYEACVMSASHDPVLMLIKRLNPPAGSRGGEDFEEGLAVDDWPSALLESLDD